MKNNAVYIYIEGLKSFGILPSQNDWFAEIVDKYRFLKLFLQTDGLPKPPIPPSNFQGNRPRRPLILNKKFIKGPQPRKVFN